MSSSIDALRMSRSVATMAARFDARCTATAIATVPTKVATSSIKLAVSMALPPRPGRPPRVFPVPAHERGSAACPQQTEQLGVLVIRSHSGSEMCMRSRMAPETGGACQRAAVPVRRPLSVPLEGGTRLRARWLLLLLEAQVRRRHPGCLAREPSRTSRLASDSRTTSALLVAAALLRPQEPHTERRPVDRERLPSASSRAMVRSRVSGVAPGRLPGAVRRRQTRRVRYGASPAG